MPECSKLMDEANLIGHVDTAEAFRAPHVEHAVLEATLQPDGSTHDSHYILQTRNQKINDTID